MGSNVFNSVHSMSKRSLNSITQSFATQRDVNQKYASLVKLLDTKLNLDGSNLDRSLNLNNQIIANLKSASHPADGVNKSYVDYKLANFLSSKLDKKFTEDLDCSNKRLKNIGNPLEDRDAVNRNYVDSAIDKLNQNMLLKENVEGDSSDSLDAANKLYVQLINQNDDVDIDKLIKIGKVISDWLKNLHEIPIISKYTKQFNSIQFSSVQFNSALRYATAMVSKYNELFENKKKIENYMLFVDLKANIIHIIEELPENLFLDLKKTFSANNLISTPAQHTTGMKYRKFINKLADESDPKRNSPTEFLVQKNLLLIDLGFVYFIEKLLKLLIGSADKIN